MAWAFPCWRLFWEKPLLIWIGDNIPWPKLYGIFAIIYYAAKRHGFTIPYPIEIQHNINAPNGIPVSIPKVQPETQSVIASLISTLSYFANLEPETLEQVIQETQLLTYGIGELIIQEDRPDDGIQKCCVYT